MYVHIHTNPTHQPVFKMPVTSSDDPLPPGAFLQNDNMENGENVGFLQDTFRGEMIYTNTVTYKSEELVGSLEHLLFSHILVIIIPFD